MIIILSWLCPGVGYQRILEVMMGSPVLMKYEAKHPSILIVFDIKRGLLSKLKGALAGIRTRVAAVTGPHAGPLHYQGSI